MTLKEMIYALRGVESDSKYHPERDQFNHTMQVTFLSVGRLPEVEFGQGHFLVKAAALHDVGKKAAIARNGTTHGHESDSVELIHGQVEEEVEWLIKNHIRIMLLDEMRKGKREALMNHPLFPVLKILRECDTGGRKPGFLVTAFHYGIFNDILKSVGIE
jgi:hypothetical protein